MKAAIAELEHQVAEIDEAKARLDQRRDRVVAVLNDLRDLEGDETPAAPTPRRVGKTPARASKVAPRPTTARHPKGERVKAARRGPGGSMSKMSPETLARAKAVAAREGAGAAAAVAGVSRERIRQIAKKQGWPILKLKGGRPKEAAPKKAAGPGTLGLVNQGPLGGAAHKTQREKAREQEDHPLRRCECGALTRTDPCGACKQPWSDTMKKSIA